MTHAVTDALPHMLRPGTAALVVAHPGHELRVHGWLERARPRVFVLTDGSGRTSASRLPSTAAVVAGAGAGTGPIFGRFTDAAFYNAVLGRDWSLFTGLAGELARALADDDVHYVVGDAAEGYNPTHDVCRLLIDAAVRVAARTLDRPVHNYAFNLVGRPGNSQETEADAFCLSIGREALARKLQVARGYAEMAGEVTAALDAWGADAFAVECFRAAGHV